MFLGFRLKNNELIIWDSKNGQELGRLSGHEEEIHKAIFSGKLL